MNGHARAPWSSDQDLGLVIADPLDRAKRYQNLEGRRWLQVGQADSYRNCANRVEAYVLEGSPVRGFLLAWRNGDGYVTRAVRLDAWGRRLRTFYVIEEA